MAAAVELLQPSTPFVAKGKLFRKEVLRAGHYQHPTNPWDEPLDLTNDDIEQVAANSQQAMEAGNRVWIPKTHSSDPEKNRGYARRFETGPSSEDPNLLSVYAITDITNPVTARKIQRGEIEDVSVGLVDYADGREREFGLRIDHIALVPDPVVPGQDSFVALARRNGKKSSRNRVLAYSGAENMKPEIVPGLSRSGIKIRRALSITPTIRKALSLTGVKVEGSKIRKDDLDEILAGLIEKASATGATGTEAATKALSRSADETFKELHGERESGIATAVDSAVKTGRIPKAVEGDLKALLSVRHGFSLSVAGKAETVDVAASLKRILAAIPEGACLDLADRIKQRDLSIAGGKPAAEAGTFDRAAETARRLEKSFGQKPKA